MHPHNDKCNSQSTLHGHTRAGHNRVVTALWRVHAVCGCDMARVLPHPVRGATATAHSASRMPLPSLASLSLAQHRKPAPRSARTGGAGLGRPLFAEASDDDAAPAVAPAAVPAVVPATRSRLDLTDLTDRPEDEQSSIILAELKHDRTAGCLLLQALLKSKYKPSLAVLQNIIAELRLPRPKARKAGESAPWAEWMEAVRFYCQTEGQEDPLTRVFIAARLGDVALLKKVMALHADYLASLEDYAEYEEDTIYHDDMAEAMFQDIAPDPMDPDQALRIVVGLKVKTDFMYLVHALRIALSYGHFEVMDFVLETLIDRQLDIVPLRQDSVFNDTREEQRFRYIGEYEFECAARSQNVKVLEWLDEKALETKEDIEWASKGLAYSNNFGVVKWFVEKGVDFSKMKVGIFESAMKSGNVKLMEWLSENHFADGDIAERANLNWFHMAAGFGHVDVMEWLAALEGFSRTNATRWISALNGSADRARPEALAFAFEKLDELDELAPIDVREFVSSHKTRVQTYLAEINWPFASIDYHSFLKVGERSKAEIRADAKACIDWLEAKLRERGGGPGSE